GIRDSSVTGVQTCALPIFVLAREVAEDALDRGRRSLAVEADRGERPHVAVEVPSRLGLLVLGHEQRGRALRRDTCDSEPADLDRSEERRVGKAWRSGAATA